MRSYLPQLTPRRRGIIMVITAVMLIVLFAFVAFSVDVGYMTLTKGQLQNAADAAAMAGVRELANGENAVQDAAKEIALENEAAGYPVSLANGDILIGRFDYASKTFTPTAGSANAVQVTARVADQPLFFAPILKSHDFDMSATGIAMLNPRDIVFVVDLSGSMNDDTEPVWATRTINDQFGPLGYPNVATGLVQDLFDDFGYGTFPGTYQHIGPAFGFAADDFAYAEITKDNGPLADPALDPYYRIESTDDEYARRDKCYRYLIDHQIASLMPDALPPANSTVHFDYWAKYLDYLIDGEWVGPAPPPPVGGGGGGTTPPTTPPPPAPPIGRNDWRIDHDWTDLFTAPVQQAEVQVAGLNTSLMIARQQATMVSSSSYPGMPRNGLEVYEYLPWGLGGQYMWGCNNPNYFTFPSAYSGHSDWKNQIGYVTYLQFMLDHGRDLSPSVYDGTEADPGIGGKTPLSVLSPYCPMHSESTAGGTFSFPPRSQPMHSVRRAMIAAINTVKTKNAGIQPGYGDRVAIVTYDGVDAYHTPQLVLPLTADFNAAMQACTTLQAVSDVGNTTATESGLIAARNHLKTTSEGGAARSFANKVIVLLTDGVPNQWSSSSSTVSSYMAGSGSGEFYGSDYIWYNACLMQAGQCSSKNVTLYPIGMGLGTDYDFMDRMARLAGTDEAGQSVRGSGNPAEYEERLIDIFNEIVKNPGGRLVD
ncbi:MAG: VWA domain-containing protein [Planctomycetaceae bacterium]